MPDSSSVNATYRKPKKVEGIIRAASRAIGKRGYAQVSMRDIAEAARVPQSLLHYYFKNKNQLMEELLRFLNRRYIGIIQKVVDLPLSTSEKIRRGLEEFQKFSKREPKWMLMILDLLVQAIHRPESKKEALSLYEELEAIIVASLREANEVGEAWEDFDEKVLAALMIATMTGLGVLFVLDKKTTDFPLAYSYFSRMLEGFLGLEKEHQA